MKACAVTFTAIHRQMHSIPLSRPEIRAKTLLEVMLLQMALVPVKTRAISHGLARPSILFGSSGSDCLVLIHFSQLPSKEVDQVKYRYGHAAIRLAEVSSQIVGTFGVTGVLFLGQERVVMRGWVERG